MIPVVAAIIRRDGRILITQRPMNVHLPGLWEFPGGKVQEGESFADALRREIREELDLDIDVLGEYLRIVHHYPEKSVDLHFYDCAIVRGEPQAIEAADFRWVLPAELPSFEFPAADEEIVRALSHA